MRNRILLLTGIALVAFSGIACDRDGSLEPTTAVSSSLNNGEPYQADALEQGEDIALLSDDYIGEDVIPVEFFAKPYADNAILNPGLEAGDFLIQSYTISYERVDGGPSLGWADFQGFTSILVKNDKHSVGSVILVPASYKTVPGVTALQYAAGEILMRATYTFIGKELSTNREAAIVASVTLNIFDWVIVTSDKNS